MSDSDVAIEPRWHWRNCRSLGVSLHLSVWPWVLIARREDGYDGGRMAVFLGPLGITIEYGIGNRSSENRLVALTSLAEDTAWERACRYEGWTS